MYTKIAEFVLEIQQAICNLHSLKKTMKSTKSWKQLFNLSRREMRGFLVLMSVSAVLIIVNIILILIPQKPTEYKIQDIQPMETVYQSNDAGVISPNHKENNKANLFTFDPNTANEDEFRSLGIKSYVIKNIIKYRMAGGTFRQKSDFRKVYGMDSTLFKTLNDYIQLPEVAASIEKRPYDSIKSYSPKKFSRVIVEINSADSALLNELSGIGPSFSSRIIKYRKRLGGFYCKEQLLEVYGMDSSRYNGIKNQIDVDASLITKIDLNQISFKDLLKHPYFEYHTVKAIMDYRNKYKRFSSLEELTNIALIYPDLLLKIKSYIVVNPPEL